MRFSQIRMQNFKYFDDLTIEIPPEADLILLVGPNGQGKSCVFDAINHIFRWAKLGYGNSDKEYLGKDKNQSWEITILDSKTNSKIKPDKFSKVYGRTSYRFTKDITRTSITQAAAQAVKEDNKSPAQLNDLDQRIEDDVEAILGEFLKEVQILGQKTDDILNRLINPINISLKNIFGENSLQLKSILNPFDQQRSSKIDILFTKNDCEITFKNLSAGEKEIFDIIFNFFSRVNHHIGGGIYYIDEPELHINTSIQTSFLKELSRLCKENEAQLWVATHSIGFLREAQDMHRKNIPIAIYEFSSSLSKGIQTLKPSVLQGWRHWQQIFSTPLNDLAELTLPKELIYCEGSKENLAIDEMIYNQIFGGKYPDTFFISSGGCGEVITNSKFACLVFAKISIASEFKLLILKDRDGKSDSQRTEELKKNLLLRILERRELENYLFDLEILQKYKSDLDIHKFKELVTDIVNDDVKSKVEEFKKLCNFKGKREVFMKELAEKVSNDSNIYKELENIIFQTNQKIK